MRLTSDSFDEQPLDAAWTSAVERSWELAEAVFAVPLEPQLQQAELLRFSVVAESWLGLSHFAQSAETRQMLAVESVIRTRQRASELTGSCSVGCEAIGQRPFGRSNLVPSKFWWMTFLDWLQQCRARLRLAWSSSCSCEVRWSQVTWLLLVESWPSHKIAQG